MKALLRDRVLDVLLKYVAFVSELSVATEGWISPAAVRCSTYGFKPIGLRGAVSGHAPEEPVISTKSGHLYEKRLVEKHVQEHGTCPVTGQPLSLDDLVAVKGNKIIKPRASPATSIPGLLSIFHNDAATRVIARLNRENGDLKKALEELGSRRAAAPADMANGGVRKETEGMEDPVAKRAKAGLTAEIVEEISAKNAELSRNRRKRAVPPGTASKADVGGYALADSFALHDTTKGGILSIAVRPDSESEVATGGADASVQLFDWKQKRSVASLSGHSKKVRSVAFAGRDLLLSGSDDKTVRLWRSKDSGFEAAAVLSGTHSDAVQAVEVHPVQKYAVSVSADKSWAFYDVDVGACLKVVTHGVGGEDKVGDGYTCAKLHPDGVILAAGSADKKVHIWEVREQKYMTTFAAHTGAVRSLSFSENGYQLATAADDGIRLWDLRKLKNFHTITPFDAAGAAAVAYDFSGQFLACGGPDAQIYAGAKTEWSRLATVQDVPKKGVLSLTWGANARQLFVGCSDHNLRVIS